MTADPPAPDEKCVAKPVQISHYLRRNFFFPRQRHANPLRAPAHGAADMQLHICAAAAGQDERAQLRQTRIHLVDLRFEKPDLRFGHTRLFRMRVFRTGGQNGTEIEQLVLHALEDRRQIDHRGVLVRQLPGRQTSSAHKRIQLIDRAVCFDTPRIFGQPLSAHKARFALVSALRVNAVQRQPRLVECLHNLIMSPGIEIPAGASHNKLMATTTQIRPPSPELIFDTLNAYQKTAALRGAIELDLFTAIGEGAVTAADLALKLKVSERGARILCDYLVVNGLLTKQGNRYGLTPDSAAFLDRRSPACMASVTTFLNSPMLMDGFRDVAASVRKGGAVFSAEGTMAPEHPVWVEFAHAMVPMTVMASEFIADLVGAGSGAKCRVLDIAAGHGMYGIAIARRNPDAAIVGQDWQNVLEVAKENAKKAGVADRYETLTGSAFEADFGSGYDLVLLTNFLHHFDPPTCETLLRKVHAALKPGGKAVTLEFVPNEDRVTPPVAAAFSLMMLGSTASGDAYTFAELDGMFRNAGFASSKAHAMPGPETVIVSVA
jgi:SAM-dependent methyltransferase